MAAVKVRDKSSLRANLCSQKEKQGTFARNWWVVLFISICGLIYFNSISKKWDPRHFGSTSWRA